MTKSIGHRGFGVFEMENTIPAFQKAIENNLDMVEIDVMLTKDSQVIVFHDRSLKRLANINKRISEINYNILEKVNIFSPKRSPFFYYGKIPLLNDAIQLCKDKIEMNIELKSSGKNNQLLVDKVLKIIHTNNIKEQVILTSFNRDILFKIQEIDKNIKTGLISIRINKRIIDYTITNKINAIIPNLISIKKKYVKYAQNNGLIIYCWTANKRKSIRKMLRLGVDGIITNLPLRLNNMIIEEKIK